MQDFDKCTEGRQFLTKRAPILADLLNGTWISRDGYDEHLEKKLCCRAWLAGTLDEDLCEKNRNKAYEDEDDDGELVDAAQDLAVEDHDMADAMEGAASEADDEDEGSKMDIEKRETEASRQVLIKLQHERRKQRS